MQLLLAHLEEFLQYAFAEKLPLRRGYSIAEKLPSCWQSETLMCHLKMILSAMKTFSCIT